MVENEFNVPIALSAFRDNGSSMVERQTFYPKTLGRGFDSRAGQGEGQVSLSVPLSPLLCKLV